MTVRENVRHRVREGAGAAAAPGVEEVVPQLEQHRVELTGYCYRMLGSAFEAEDAVQETLVRAWRGAGRFEGRSSLRTWLYTIATHVCLDSLNADKRRARPMDLSPASHADAVLPAPTAESDWVGPVPDARAVSSGGDPADVVVARETIRLAFVAALQHLPPRQRAVLILREVLAWKASETAELLGGSVASVNSALQRARATLAGAGVGAVRTAPAPAMDAEQQSLLDRYVDAFERYDLDSLTRLLHEDATLSMPPYPLWLRGHEDIRAWFLGTGIGCRGSRLLPVAANGAPGFGQYRPAEGGGHRPWALQVLEISGGRVTGICSFLDTPRLFPLFGLPLELPPERASRELPAHR
ncbi:RNA polymerase, sigma subunit, ECF family [Streptomyces sp. DvalAA-14]|uniref:sigma-70 family RNA polymerase sigma factor n=1 Tax=unclassified Streptomyces TaxID=2593676 RepID=UPI00081BA786|nr:MULTISPECIES: sigma-70 family RNA polymerase sigma factor [unclassified Streptomyces]MYS18754.1 sigma-70 family RNA polymerase sigma factor [Streptomyces sp. SID4948]SCD28755.1 RNA polymerase, sigma subunit, ECF family [Streptomyces sp. DvalAA-14]